MYIYIVWPTTNIPSNDLSSKLIYILSYGYKISTKYVPGRKLICMFMNGDLFKFSFHLILHILP